MKNIYISILLLIYAHTVFSTTILKGRILEYGVETPIEFATVSLLDAQKKQIIAGAISNISGYFTIEDIPQGEYELKISYVGYIDKVEKIKVNTQNVALPTIFLREDTQLLSEFEV